MSTSPKVSILVPIYGVEKYIERCAISLFEQSYDNIEYIFVNDCTKDKSIDILKSVIAHYPNRRDAVKIIKHECNRGLAAARNTAVAAATGDFVMHVDSDDWLETTAVEQCVLKQRVTDADIVTMDAKVWWPKYIAYYKTPEFSSPDVLLKEMLRRHVIWNVWGRLIRRSLYSDYNIKTIEGCNMGEDAQVMIPLVCYSGKVTSVCEVLYNYDSTIVSSYSATFSVKKFSQVWQTIDHIYAFISANKPSMLDEAKSLVAITAADQLKDVALCKDAEEYHICMAHIERQLQLTEKKHWKAVPFFNRIMLVIHNRHCLYWYMTIASCIKQRINVLLQ